MPHRIDTVKIADQKSGKDNIKLAKARLDEIAALPATATTAQLRAAIKDLAAAIRHIIKALPVLLLLSSACFAATATVGITWDANTDNPTGYHVCWSNYSGSAKSFAFRNCSTVRHPANTKTVTGLSTAEKWVFRGHAYNDFAESDWSNYAQLWFVKTPTNNKFQRVEIR